MSRIRTIKPEFWTSEQVIACSPISRLLFIGLWSFCDDNGVHPASYIRLKAEVFPANNFSTPEIKQWINELINNELLKEINKGMKDKFTLNKALCTADLFEFLHRKKVRIYSDKTGTVTEAFMVMRDIVYVDKPGAREKIAKAFATIFSDQKTEAEENEIKRYFSATQGLVIESNPIPNQAESFCKKITQAGYQIMINTDIRVGHIKSLII